MRGTSLSLASRVGFINHHKLSCAGESFGKKRGQLAAGEGEKGATHRVIANHADARRPNGGAALG
jgi:hypothetical protein